MHVKKHNVLQYGMKRIASDFVTNLNKAEMCENAPNQHFTAFCYIAF
jgi:hypothetical protein